MLMLDFDDMERFCDEARKRMYDYNRIGELERIAKTLGMDEWCEESQNVYHGGKIAIIGARDVSQGECVSIFKKLGIDKDRLLYCDYDHAKTYNYDGLINNIAVRVIMFGPIPHSTTGKGNESSTIVTVEKKIAEFNKDQGEEITKVIRLTDKAGNLKITHKGVENKLNELIETGYISTDF